MLHQITSIVTRINENEILYLDSPVLIHSSFIAPVVMIWAVCVSPLNDLYVMDGNEVWYPGDPLDSALLKPLLKHLQAVERRYVGVLVSTTEVEDVMIAEPINA